MKAFFTNEEKQKIVDAICQAEKNTSGEIRVHIDKTCNEDVLDRAAWWFKQLKMEKTKQRNGVLIYIATESKKFAIIGDAGINAAVPANFWESTKNVMLDYFKQSRFADGIVYAVLEAGMRLKDAFPYQADDVNELDDDISFGAK